MSYLTGDTEDLFQVLQQPNGHKMETTDDAGSSQKQTGIEEEQEDLNATLDVFSEEVKQTLPTTDATAPILSLSHEVRHEVAIPDGYEYVPLSQHVPPEKAAREYAF